MEGDDLDLKISTFKDISPWEDGEPHGEYRFEIRHRHAEFLTIYAGVNMTHHDERVGDDTLFIIDIIAHPTDTDLDYNTGRSGAYETGIRIGHTAVRKLLKDILAIVRKDFPTVSRLLGLRSTGAKWKSQKQDRHTTQRV